MLRIVLDDRIKVNPGSCAASKRIESKGESLQEIESKFVKRGEEEDEQRKKAEESKKDCI